MINSCDRSGGRNDEEMFHQTRIFDKVSPGSKHTVVDSVKREGGRQGGREGGGACAPQLPHRATAGKGPAAGSANGRREWAGPCGLTPL